MEKINVIFLGAGLTALAGIREIGEYGLQVFAVGSSKYEAGLFSKYVKSIGTTDPEKNPEILIQLLKTFAKNNKGTNILIPTGDEYVEFLSENKKILSDNFKFHNLENNISDLFLNKEKFYTLCQETHTPAPKTWTSKINIPLDKWADNVYYPCFIKPIYVHKWRNVYGLKKGFLVHDKNELLSKYEDVSKHVLDLIVQEVIEGDADQLVTFSANFDRNSNPEQIFTARKKRQYPEGFGTATCFVSEDINEIKNYAINILGHVGYRGPCDVEFKYDKRDHTYKIIEVNPRIGRFYRLVTKSGKRPLLSSILDLANIDTVLEEKEQKNEIHWLFPIRDIFIIMQMSGEEKKNALKDYFGKSKVWCVYETDDKRPFFAYFMEMLMKLYNFRKQH